MYGQKWCMQRVMDDKYDGDVHGVDDDDVDDSSKLLCMR